MLGNVLFPSVRSAQQETFSPRRAWHTIDTTEMSTPISTNTATAAAIAATSAERCEADLENLM